MVKCRTSVSTEVECYDLRANTHLPALGASCSVGLVTHVAGRQTGNSPTKEPPSLSKDRVGQEYVTAFEYKLPSFLCSEPRCLSNTTHTTAQTIASQWGQVEV